MTLRVLIVDDNEPFIDSARALLEREGVRVVGAATTTDEAIRMVRETQPGVVLLDLHLGSVSGLDVAAELDAPGGPAVVLVSSGSYDEVRDLLIGAPVRGFVSKVELSAAAIEAVLVSH